MAERVVNAGVVGLGVGAVGILRQLEMSSTFRLCAGADTDPVVRAGFQGAFPDARVYDSIEALARDPDVEAVWVATPNRLHAEQTVLLADAGKHVVVQKPMALTIEEAVRMVDATERNGVHLIAGNSHCYKTPFQMMGQIARSGELGEVRAINVIAYNGWMLQERLPEDLDPAEGGGVIYRAVPHQVDAIRLIGGRRRLKTVRGNVAGWTPERPGPAYAAAYLEFEDGVPAVIIQNAYGYFMAEEMMTWASAPDQYRQFERRARIRQGFRDGTRSEGEYRERRVGGALDRGGDIERGREWAADLGVVIASCERGDMRQSPDGVYVYSDAGIREIKVAGGSLWEKEQAELYDAIVNGREGFHGGRSGLASFEVVMALMESARTGREVELQHQVEVDEHDDPSHLIEPIDSVQLL